MYSRALEGYEEALGPMHISTLNTVNNLGNLYKDLGKLAEAKQMYSRALEGYEEALAQKVSSSIPALNTCLNLGNVFSSTEKMDQARKMYNRAHFGFAAIRGPDADIYQQIGVSSKALDGNPAAAMDENVETQLKIPKSERLARRILGKIRRRGA